MKLTRYKHDSEVSYAFGATLVFELIKTHPELITLVYLRPEQKKQGENLVQILEQLRSLKKEIIESSKAFNILGAKDSCLLIAEFKKPSTKLNNSANSSHIILVNPSDTGNLGTIMRSAIAFDYENLAIITPAVDPFDPKTVRASMGAVFHLNIQEFRSFDEYKTANKDRELYSFILNDKAETLEQVKLQGKNFGLIFGNEASGLPTVYGEITKPIFIPQSKNVDSLNLSIAASVAMYKLSSLHNH